MIYKKTATGSIWDGEGGRRAEGWGEGRRGGEAAGEGGEAG